MGDTIPHHSLFPWDIMTLIALRCPHCGGTVNMEDNLASGFCTFCGNMVVNDQVAANLIQAETERRQNVTSMLRMVKHHLEDGDTYQAESLLKSAMMLDSANSDCWYMDAVMDPKNRENDIARAEGYPSLGVFTRHDLDRFNGVRRSTNGALINALCFMLIFISFATSVPIAMIFEKWIILVPVVVLDVVVFSIALMYIRKGRKPVR
jgi:hypothetical protein